MRRIGDGHACPDRIGRDHASVEEDQGLAFAGLDVVDVDAVRADHAPVGLSKLFLKSHGAPSVCVRFLETTVRIAQARHIGRSPDLLEEIC